MPDQTQTAVQLVGPDALELNRAKPIPAPGERQILGRVCCVGLCFSDMKLLHQFDQHVRKGPVVAGIDQGVLEALPSYVPGDKPTVPGHEVVIEIVAAGEQVTSVQVGQRYLVQADWRELKTDRSNGAFGYDFEGGLQEYVLLDERVTVASDGTSYLLPAGSDRSASATALVEPWACVEDAFIHPERDALQPGGTLLLVRSDGAEAVSDGLDLSACARRLYLSDGEEQVPESFEAVRLDELTPESVDDLLFAGADAELFEQVLPLLAKNGLALIATGGMRFEREVALPVGRVHYGNIRVAGYPGTSFAKALARIPATGEVRPGDRVHVVGAAGPMGSMAVIRVLSLGLGDVAVEGADMAADRLAVLARKAEPLSARKQVPLHLYDPRSESPQAPADYVMIMVPVGALVAAAVREANPGALINIFAGIPADVHQAVDLDAYVEKGLYFIGTSGSTMEDIHAVLNKVAAGELDTDLSVGAVSGMGGAIDGLRAVDAGAISGKILVYPELGDFPLTTLEELGERCPAAAAALDNGNWNQAAERALLGG